MKVYELIKELERFDGDKEVIFWIHNLNSWKRYDMQIKLADIRYDDGIVFCDREREFPIYRWGSGVYIEFSEPWEIEIKEEDYIIYE